MSPDEVVGSRDGCCHSIAESTVDAHTSLLTNFAIFLVTLLLFGNSKKKTGNAFSDALLKSRFQNFTDDAANKKPTFCADF